MANNISLLVNQNDEISDILAANHAKGQYIGRIVDFTIRKMRYLYLLYTRSVVVLDFGDVLSSNHGSAADLKFVRSIRLSASPGEGEDKSG